MYHIARAENFKFDTIIYSLKKRLSDFKAEEGVEYVVYRSKTEMRKGSGWFSYYIGTNGKLKKSKTKGFMRFGSLESLRW